MRKGKRVARDAEDITRNIKRPPSFISLLIVFIVILFGISVSVLYVLSHHH